VQYGGDRLSQRQISKESMTVCAENEEIQALLFDDAHQFFRGIAIT
jgi:hypothetical protein